MIFHLRLFIIFVIMVASNSVFPQQICNLGCSETQDELSNEVKSLDCQIKDIAQKIKDQTQTVPSSIYHFGKEIYMMENVNARTIPSKAWNDFIMSEKTRYSLQSVRRGLYGTGGIDTNGFGGGEYNWMIEIQITKECRNPKNVVSLLDLPDSDRFKKWFESSSANRQAFSDLESFRSSCYQKQSPSIDYQGSFKGNEKCSILINDYLENTDVKIVQDHFIRKSFYIRDRNCIKSIKGTPEEILNMAVENDFLWITPCSSGFSSGAYSFSQVILSALKKNKNEASEKAISKLKENFKMAGVPIEPLDAYLRCQRKGEMEFFRQAKDKLNELCL